MKTSKRLSRKATLAPKRTHLRKARYRSHPAALRNIRRMQRTAKMKTILIERSKSMYVILLIDPILEANDEGPNAAQIHVRKV